MTMQVQSAAPSAIASSGTGHVDANHTTTLLPQPSVEGDPMAALYTLLSQNRTASLKQGIGDLHRSRKLKKQELDRAKAALREAAKAQKKGGFFSRLAKKCAGIAKYAAVAASVALAVGTAGAGTPIAILAISGAAMSTAAVVQSETQILQKMGMSDDWANGFQTGLMIGGAACGLATGAALLCGAGGQVAASSLQVAAQKLGSAAAGVQGLSTAAGGYAGWQAGEANADATKQFAEVAKARAAEERLERMVMQILSDIEASEKADQRTLGHLRGAIEARDNTLSICSTKV